MTYQDNKACRNEFINSLVYKLWLHLASLFFAVLKQRAQEDFCRALNSRVLNSDSNMNRHSVLGVDFIFDIAVLEWYLKR